MTDDTPAPLRPASPSTAKKLTVDFDGGSQSSDAGLLLLREAERKLGVCRRLAAAIRIAAIRIASRHEMFEMVMARTSAIALRAQGCDRSRPAAARSAHEGRRRPPSADWGRRWRRNRPSPAWRMRRARPRRRGSVWLCSISSGRDP